MIAPETWKSILKIFFAVRRSVEDAFAGEYKSVFKGQGLEFEEVREYVQGDDIRNIDWKVTARFGHPFVKKYIEERELTIVILLDLSSSLDFGTKKSKKEIAAELTATLAWAAIANNDRIGMLLFSDKVEKYVTPQKNRHQILKLIREVLTLKPEGNRTDLRAAIEYLYRMLKKRAIVFVISDFYADDYEKPLKILNKKHDVIPVIISDPWEYEVGLNTVSYLEDSENEKIYSFSRQNKSKIKKALAELNRKREEFFKTAAMDYVDLNTGRPYVNDLLKFFKRRFVKR